LRRPPAARRLGRPPAADSGETEERILRAARSAFARSGYERTTNREIAEAAGITSAAIYHYFGSKLDLFGAVAGEVEEQITARLRADLDRSRGASLAELLSVLIDATVALIRDDPSLGRFITSLPHEAARSPEIGEMVGTHLAAIQQIFEDVVHQAAARGELAEGVETQPVIDMVLATFMGLASMPTRATEFREIADGFRGVIQGTLLTA